MSIESRMRKYWNHDVRVCKIIIRDVGADEDKIKHHPLNGSMNRYAKHYRRLVARGHECRMLTALADRVITVIGF